jgi:hypothetical protein
MLDTDSNNTDTGNTDTERKSPLLNLKIQKGCASTPVDLNGTGTG